MLTVSSSGLLGREAEEADGAAGTRSGGRPASRGRLGRHDVLVEELHTSNHQLVRAVTDRGRVLGITASEVPPVVGRSRGAALAELFAVDSGERWSA